MAIRTTDDEVEAIIEVDVEDIDLAPFITAASALVDEIAEPSGHTDARLLLIETWLAAHFFTVRSPRPVQEAAGSVQQTNQSKVDLGLSTSHYGQHAMILDTSGLLRAISLGKRKRISVTWLGIEEDRGYAAEEET